jgi:hypothetical protein
MNVWNVMSFHAVSYVLSCNIMGKSWNSVNSIFFQSVFLIYIN